MNSHEYLLPIRALLMVGALLLASASMARRAWAADPNSDNPGVENLLDQARFQANRLDVDADNLTALLRSQVTWQGRANELTKIKLHINDLGKLTTELQSSRADASPWQKQAVDQMIPLLREMAAITGDEIRFLNEHQNWPISSENLKWANQNFTAARELANLTSETVQYGEDRADLAVLSDNLHLHARAGTSNGTGQRASR
jgi:hypothetical protein